MPVIDTLSDDEPTEAPEIVEITAATAAASKVIEISTSDL